MILTKFIYQTFYLNCFNKDNFSFKQEYTYYLEMIQTDVDIKILEFSYRKVLFSQRKLLFNHISSPLFDYHLHNHKYTIYDPYRDNNLVAANYNLDVVLTDVFDGTNTIPYLSHRFWIFNNKMVFPNDTQLSITSLSISKLTSSSYNSWIHFFLD
jgi:hypothetical protein